MTLEEVKAKAETFFDWPSEDRTQITYCSAMLFAWDCCKDIQDIKESNK